MQGVGLIGIVCSHIAQDNRQAIIIGGVDHGPLGCRGGRANKDVFRRADILKRLQTFDKLRVLLSAEVIAQPE